MVFELLMHLMKIYKLNCLVVFILSVFFSGCTATTGDIYVIRGGTIIDGNGTTGVIGNLMIKEGKIFRLGMDKTTDNVREIDAHGLIVAPGFIDVHNHSDKAIGNPGKRLNEGYIRQGVTTIVGGPDGAYNPSTIKARIAAYQKNGIGTNVAFYVGHNGIRREVMQQDQQRAPTVEEMDQMKALVQEGMELGAVGFSTALVYSPGIYSNTEEIVELSKVAARYNGIYDSHTRSPVHAFDHSVGEAIAVAEGAMIPAKIAHFKAVGLHNAGMMQQMVAQINEARRRGIAIFSDQYPYDAALIIDLTELIILPPDLQEIYADRDLDPHDGEDRRLFDLKRALQDPANRQQIKAISENAGNDGFSWIKATGYNCFRITNSQDYPDLIGQYLSDLAVQRGADPFDVVCDLIIHSAFPVFITLGAIKEKDVRDLLTQPWNMIASDGGYTEPSRPSYGHPRSTGTFPRVLGHYVRELNLLSIEEAIRKMTSLPADVIGLADRGRVAEGLAADIVIFDPRTIIDRSSYIMPHIYADGILHVFVNGVPVLLDGKLTGKAPGKYLRSSGSKIYDRIK
jgi:N-acyl-D-amino-acid deacylase